MTKVESFVDPARFAGTCYRAANWVELGRTQGWGRTRGSATGYAFHGQAKLVFARELRRGARALLAAAPAPAAWEGRMNELRLEAGQITSLWEHLRRVPDFRARRGVRHPLPTVLAIALTAQLAGSRNATEIAEFAGRMTQEELRAAGARRFPDGYRPPAHNTFRRVLLGIDESKLEAQFNAWLCKQGTAAEPFEPLALDGKHMRGSYDRDRVGEPGETLSEAPRQQLAAVGIDTRQVYAQKGFSGKKDDAEPQVAREVLQALDLRGRLVALDALHTQAATARTILAGGGHYLFTVKGNQPGLLAALAGVQWERCEALAEIDAGHGRIERREIRVVEANGPGPDGRSVAWLDFPGARVAARVVREVRDKKTGAARKPATAYLLTSLPPRHASRAELLGLNRGYWGAVENGVHRVRDGGAFQEDSCRARKGRLASVLAAFRNMVITILRMMGVRSIAKAIRELGADPRRTTRILLPSDLLPPAA